MKEPSFTLCEPIIKRRRCGRKLYYRMLFALAAMLWGCSQSYAAERPPNILLVISDDQGYGDFGFTGNEVVRTPNLDQLARQSAFYSNFLVAPACTPTRSALLTGRNHLLTGVWGVGPRGDVRRDEVLMPAFFKPSGYHTWILGKVDGAKMMELGPLDRGFDWFFIIGGGYLHKRPRIFSPGSGKWTEGWTADIMTDKAIEKIRKAGNRPWLAHVAYIIPHLPWVCPDEYADPFRRKGLSEALAQCYGSITHMDHNIGRLLEAVREAGQDKNTIVLFLSDNGPTEGRRAWVNNNYENAENTSDWKVRNPLGLTGHKAEAWDNGIRSPLLVRWPGRIPPGERKQLAAVEDILPTLLDLCGMKDSGRPEHLPFTGVTLRASLENAKASVKRDEVFRLALAGPGAPGTAAKGGIIEDAAAVDYNRLHAILRGERYKFHHLPGGKHKLFDILTDPAEKRDIGPDHPELITEKAQRCRKRWKDIAESGRALQMAHSVVNNAAHPHTARWRVPANRGQRLKGGLKCIFSGGCRGFRRPGDRIDYRVDVQQAGSFSLAVTGKGLDAAATIELLVNGSVVKAKDRTAMRISFDAAQLPAGFSTLTLRVPAHAAPGTAAATVDQIVLDVK